MDPEKQARLEAAGFHVTNDPRDLLEPLEVIEELRARVARLEAALNGTNSGQDLDSFAVQSPDTSIRSNP